MDAQKFQEAIDSIINQPSKNTIGTLSEKTLHAVVKRYYEENQELHEHKIGPYYVDVFQDNQVIEVQTKQFNKLYHKLEYLLKDFQVRVVYPTFYQKWLIWVNPENNEETAERLSPKKGTFYQIYPELYRIKNLLGHPNLKLSILLIDIKEYRLLNGWSYNKKKGSHCYERIPITLRKEVNIDSAFDYERLIPGDLPTPFTSKDFQKHSKLSIRNSQIAVNVLTSLGVIEKIGKEGRMYLYERKNNSNSRFL